MPEPENFRFDRKIPLTLVWMVLSTVVLNLCASVWWAASANSRIQQLEKYNYSAVVERLVAVEVKIDQAADDFGYSRQELKELNSKIDAISRRKL